MSLVDGVRALKADAATVRAELEHSTDLLRFAMNERLTEDTRHAQEFRDFHREQAARQTAALEAIAATLIRLTSKEKP
jgi:hypothetical protein